MPAKKTLGVCSLFVPVFFKDIKDIGKEVVIPFSEVANGQALYGDKSKGTGCKNALMYAKSNNLTMKIVELIVNINTNAALRPSREDLDSGEINLMVFDKIKIDLKDELDFIFDEYIKKNTSAQKGIDSNDYLLSHPEVARCIFDEFKKLDLFALPALLPYSKDPLSVALIRNKKAIEKATVLFDNNLKVSIK